MASVTLELITYKFPVGTSVDCFEDLGLRLTSEPPGAIVATEVVAADGSLTYSALQDDTSYVCYAIVETQNRYLRFHTDPDVVVPEAGTISPPDGIEPGESLEWDGDEFVRADFAEETDLLGKQDESAIIANGLGIVEHGATAATPRPDGFAVIQWVGSVTPSNALNGDLWVDTS